MSKKKEKREPIVTEEFDAPAEEPISAQNETAHEDAAQSVVTEQAEETYTLTAEEFHAAQEHIAALQKERDESVALMQRIQADFDNYRRRNASIRADSYEDGKRECIKALIPVLDNFDRALENAATVDAGWKDGISLVYRQLFDTLNKLGLEQIEAEGQFDPTRHEAVMRESADGRESGEILAVLQKGYRVGERIIRHAMVKVAE